MLSDSLLAECKAMILDIAPELPASTYVLSAELFRGLPCDNGSSLGWADTDNLMDIKAVELLGERYIGPAPMIVLDGPAIAEVSVEGAFERCVLSVGLHEAAHVLPVRQIVEPADTPFVRYRQMMEMKYDFNAIETGTPEPGDAHGLAFVRRATHLLYRALAKGYDVSAHRLYGPQEWMSRAEYYLVELLHECDTMAAATFSEIEATPAPAGFVGRWEADQDYYQKYLKGN